jgi:UDP-N-acetylglucosamine 2-epimerase (non-hydrolysing)
MAPAASVAIRDKTRVFLDDLDALLCHPVLERGFQGVGMAGAIRLLSIAGTRPEAIKFAPIMLAAAKRPTLKHRLLATGQHGALFDGALADFGLQPDRRLPPQQPDPSPDVMTERFADALTPMLIEERPDMVLVQGDTTTAYAGAIAADRLGIPIGHVEAGLRSHDFLPWPEERNRVAIDRLAAMLFAPTRAAEANLFADDDVTGSIFVTGNTGIDALLEMRSRTIVASRQAMRRSF